MLVSVQSLYCTKRGGGAINKGEGREGGNERVKVGKKVLSTEKKLSSNLVVCLEVYL